MCVYVGVWIQDDTAFGVCIMRACIMCMYHVCLWGNMQVEFG